MKLYKKEHENKEALKRHAERIVKRGGAYQISGTSIRYAFPEDKLLPENVQQLVNQGGVKYRGSDYGTLIKVKGTEYLVSDAMFKKLGGISKIRFAAPYREE